MQPLAIGIISTLALSWRKKTWFERISQLAFFVICLNWEGTDRPLLMICLSVSYGVWTFLPGSLSSFNLPTHSTFMRNLEIVPNAAAGDHEECKVCWDEEQELAKLPCNHFCCRRCLQLMGEKFQSACPICRRPLFNSYDLAVYALSKGSVTCSAMTAVLLLVRAIINVRCSLYVELALSVFSLCFQVAYLWFVGRMVREFGDNWWRGAPSALGSTGQSLSAAAFAFVSGAFCLWQTIDTTDKLVC